MKIRGRLTFKSEKAEELVDIIACSLMPDNLPEIKTIREDGSVTVKFSANKIGTMLSSVDDFLMNAKIANDMLLFKKID